MDFLPLLHLLLSITTCFASFGQPLCHNDDSVALLEFKNSFNLDKFASTNHFAYPKVSSWRVEENRDCCSWDGVECNTDTGRVVALDLTSSFLHGSINSTSSLFKLSQLQRLNLADNDFNFSHIPFKMGHLSRLTNLNLSHSSFYGQVPFEISRLSNLSLLDLSSNDLELKSPNLSRLVRKLRNLKQLHLNYVDISSTVPSFLSNFSSLTSLLLDGCSLHSEFPNGIFQLPHLQVLDLQNNPHLMGYLPEFHSNSSLEVLLLHNTGFSGKIPSSIENLHFLHQLDFGACRLSGLVPSSLGKLTKLTSLELSGNNFEGNQFPSFLQNLTQLTKLWLKECQLIGEIPAWLGNLTQLTDVGLHVNNMHGHIPSSLGKLTRLTNLNLVENNFEGQIPSFLQNLTQLTVLWLGDNQFNGEIPSWFETFTHLTQLNLGMNKFHGLIPSSLGRLTSLIELDLQQNKFVGQIPSFLRNLTNLIYLSLQDNELSGSLYFDMFCGLKNPSSLKLLDFSNNHLTGMLPQCFENLNNSPLMFLKMSNNRFHGNIPQICAHGSNLRMIDLSHNQFQGPLPHMLANCLMLEVLNLGNNRFDDVFPSWLGTLPNLRLLILRSNNLHGVIRKHSNYGFSSLHVFDLSNNILTGKLPSEFFKNLKAMRFRDVANSSYLVANLDYFSEAISWNGDIAFSITITNKGRVMQYEKIQEIFAVIDLSSNRFEGSIPESLGILQGLHVLNLSNNILTGKIPSSLGNITELESLDLSNNKLSGQIPLQLGQLTFLGEFKVAHNHLTGPIPQLNQLNTFDVSSYEGNIGLCGIPLPKKCGSSIPPSRFEDEQDSGSALVFDWITILPGYVSGLVIGVVIGQIYATKKHDWFVKTFGQWKQKRKRRKMQRWLTSFVKKNVDYDLLNKLKFKLSSLDKVLDDAEKKQLSDPAVRKWLNELKYTYDNTEDLVYEINTEALRCEIDGKPPHLFSFLSTRSYAKSNAKQINQRIAKILGTLESIVQEKDQIGLNAGVEKNRI
nr:receptor-like protein 9DC3 [Ziziphus jujuba var. spinosa]